VRANEPDNGGLELSWEDVPTLMEDLRGVAVRLLARWPDMDSLQPTLLIDTALRRQRRRNQPWQDVTWENRDAFFRNVFRAMRQKLGEYRRHQATRGYRAKRRMSVAEFDLYERWRHWTEDPDLAMALEVGLERLKGTSPELTLLVEYRFFCGLTWDDVGKMLNLSPATVMRRWRQARVLMQEAIRETLEAEQVR
jgi:DNA-directed RNA polymerase specialized sigma24 family protein